MKKVLPTGFLILQLIQMFSCDTMYFRGKRIINNTFSHFACNLSPAPVGDTVEFLVNDITAFNIRYYADTCYATDSQIPCDGTNCKCTPDGEGYEWVFNHRADLNYSATCRAKIQQNCFIDIRLTIDAGSDRHMIRSKTCDSDSPTSMSVETKGNEFIVVNSLILLCLMSKRQYSTSVLIAILSVIVYAKKNVAAKETITLTVDYKKGRTELVCKVKYLVNEVYFHDPLGRLKGYCTAPIPGKAAGVCDNHITQNIDDNTTCLVITVAKGDDGMWICFHGMNTHEKAYAEVVAQISDNRIEDRGGMIGVGFIIGFVVCIILLALTVAGIVWNKERKKEKKDDSMNLSRNDYLERQTEQ